MSGTLERCWRSPEIQPRKRMKYTQKLVSGLVGLAFVMGCTWIEPATSGTHTPAPSTPTITVTDTPSPIPAETQEQGSYAVFLNVYERSSASYSIPISIGGQAVIVVSAEPVYYAVKRKADGSILETSRRPWEEHTLAEMRLCLQWGEPCLPEGEWQPYSPTQEHTFMVDWAGPRTLWAVAQFRDAAGAVVPSVSGSASGKEPGEASQVSLEIVGVWDEATPVEALPPPVRTAITSTKAAYPVTGSVVWEEGRCCIGGLAGSTLQAQATFSATSPLGEVTAMRVRLDGKCFSEVEIGEATWEAFISRKAYPIPVASNWVGVYISVQYRDDQGNLSPVYCDDISVEGMPAPPSTTP